MKKEIPALTLAATDPNYAACYKEKSLKILDEAVKKNQVNSREDKIVSYWSRSQIFVLIDYVGKDTILKNTLPKPIST